MNKPAIDFTDLDFLPGDPLPDAITADGQLVYLKLAHEVGEPQSRGYLEASAEIAERTLKASNKQRVEVPCPKCRGSGQWGDHPLYRRRCFGCNGTGKILRAANYEKNKAARAARAERQAAEEQALIDADRQRRIDAFKISKPDIAGWLAANTSDFALSLRETVATYGNLSVGQEAAVLKSLGRDQLAESRPGETDIDVSSLKGYYAVPDGETRLKIRVKHPGKDSRFHGWVFVDDGAAYGSQQKYGSQRPGGKYSGKIQQQLRAILADPLAAQIAYGHLTGSCGVCGRMLEDAESVAAGIGPICAGKVAAGLA